MKMLKGALVRLWISTAVALFLAGCAVPLVDEANYVAAVLSQVQRASTNITTLSALASNPQVNDPAWREQVSKQLVELRDIAIAARALTPPRGAGGRASELPEYHQPTGADSDKR